MKKSLIVVVIIFAAFLAGAVGKIGVDAARHVSNDHQVLHALVQIELQRQQATKAAAPEPPAPKP